MGMLTTYGSKDLVKVGSVSIIRVEPYHKKVMSFSGDQHGDEDMDTLLWQINTVTVSL